MIAAFGVGESHAQQAIMEGGANLLTNLNRLPGTAAGRAALDVNLETTFQIQNNATQERRNQAMRDTIGGPANAAAYAEGGLGTSLFKAFSVGNKEFPSSAFTEVPSWNQLFGSINTLSANTSGQHRLLIGQGFAAGRAWTGAGTSANTLGTPFTARLALPADGILNPYDRYYVPEQPNSAGPGGTSENTRPYFTRPGRYVNFSAVDYFGVTKDNLTANILPGKNSISFPSGHSSGGWSGALTLAMMFPERWQQQVMRGAEYSASRVVLGVHYPLDSIGGRILATWNLVQILNNNPDFTNLNLLDQRGVPLPQPSTGDYQALFNQAFTDLRASVAQACGMSITACIAAGAPDRFSDNAKNKAAYTYYLTYGLPSVGPTDLAPVVPVGAEVLLQTRFPYLTAAQRREVLATTEIASGSALDDGSGYARLNLYAAGDGYGAFHSQVAVTMNGALGGFNAADSWNNDISGSGGLTLGGSGVLTLSGRNTYTGPTIVDGGALEIAGSIVSAATVKAGGILTGAGSMGDVTVKAGGTLAPGALASMGTLAVNGTLTAQAGSQYSVRTTATTSDSTRVAGAAHLDGGTVVVAASPAAFTLGTRYTILTATGGVTGRFSGVTGTAPIAPFIGLVDRYDANAVYLDVAASFATAAVTRNQRATAAGLDGLPAGNALFAAAAHLPNAATAQSAFDRLSGDLHGSLQTQMIDDSRFARNAGIDRIRSASGAVGGSRAPVLAYAGPSAALPYAGNATGTHGFVAAPATTERLAIWTQALGDWSRRDADGNASGLTRTGGGFLIGADHAVLDGRARLGVMGGVGRSTYSAPASSGWSDDYSLGAYGGAQLGALGLRAGTAVTFHDLRTRRNVTLPGFADILTGSYSATTAQVYGQVGYGMTVGRVGLEPFADLAYVSQSTDRLAESGGLAALTMAGRTTGVTFSTLGLHASTDVTLNAMAVSLRGTLGWRHAFDDTAAATRVAFTGGTPFTSSGIPIAADAVVFDAGLDLAVGPSASLGLTYGAQFAETARSQTAKLNFTQRF
ncbi:hypothetical protein ASF28_07310 [Methylobacterium sp. Leaf99]|uniref:autotransporter domain-containing protein n=1 Tax=Methylobacterium sp. Leaf99 TaxID=1736251 RepID=UPI0006F8BE7F|nr:autotransporter domain-containing protein [Methylobacterium sp. Leaf99]KQP10886.1 hypothetical protein ASF28_07310 [Methylobacterium sp. Leaf99]